MRSLKSQGSSKIDGYCTAGFYCKYLENGRIEVEVVKTHYGHQCTVGHIRIPTVDRLYIAQQVSQGVSFDNLLDKIRDSVSSNVERIHCLLRKISTSLSNHFTYARRSGMQLIRA